MADTTQAKAQSTDVEKQVNRLALSDSDLIGIDNLAALSDILSAENVKTDSYDEEYSSGFEVLTDKSKLIDVPFLVVQWRFTKSKSFYDESGEPAEFVSAYVVVGGRDGSITNKFILNDGSTGICRQLRAVTERRVSSKHPQPQAGLMVRHGLRKSEYDVTIDGKTGKATTYYLA